jgi:hypothetical protein
MKVSPQFLVAKYVPDIQRLEPRNIGIIVWGGGFTAARFLGEKDGKLRVPLMIEKDSHDAYRQWVQYWRYQLLAKSIRTDAGVVVEKGSDQFLGALQEKSKDFFRLVNGGGLMDRIPVAALDDFASELFQKLVEPPRSASNSKSEAVELQAATKRLFAESGISGLQHDLPVPRHVHGVLRQFSVDVAIGPIAYPKAVFKKVLLTKNQSIDSSAFMFESLVNDSAHPIPKENCAALVNGSHAVDEEARSGVAMLKEIATVIDVSEKWAKDRILEIAARTETEPN